MTEQPKSNIQTQLKKIWVKTKDNKNLRDGEKARIFASLKEIQFMWGFAN